MKKTWVFSDPHYGHKNICYGVSGWGDKTYCRPFDTIDQMNEAMVNEINSKAMPDDDLICLGDWSFGGIDNISDFRKRIECKNVYLVPGNHDEHIMANKNNTQDNFIMWPQIKIIKPRKGLQIILSHFPLEHWENMEKGSMHLHGHVHNKLDNCIDNLVHKRFDVHLFNNGRFNLYDLDLIIYMLETRKNKIH